MATWKKIITAADDANYKNSNVAYDSDGSGTLPVSNGGTGATTLTNKAVLISQDTGTDAVGAVALTTSGQIIIGGTSGPAAATLTQGDNMTITNADGAITLASADTDTVYTLPEATSSAMGGLELFSDTDQSVAAESVSATASRTYGLQLNSAGQGVINVPWTDTDTDTVYTLPEATSSAMGGLELFSDTDQSVAAESVSATASRTYGLQLNSAGQGVINVPWSNTTTTADVQTALAALDGDDTTYIGDAGNDTAVEIRGDLTVSGTTTTVNTEEIKLADNIIVLNSNYTGASPTDAGLTVERGSKVDSSFFWDESAASFAMTTTGDYYSDTTTETSITTSVCPIAVQSSAPTQMPHQGSLWYDTDNDTLYVATVNTSIENP